MKRSRPFFIFLLVIFAVFLFTSFAWAAGPKYGGTLKVGIRMPQFNRLDPRYNTLESFAPASGMIYDCLFNWGADGFEGLVPQLATSYETKDNKVWVVNLRKGVKFHNGREMTAEDVKTNMDWRIKTPKGWKPLKYKEFIKYLKAVEVVDKYTVKIILEKPFSPMMRILAYAFRGVVPPEEVEKWGKKFSSHPSGTGPFKLAEMKPKVKVTLERFDDYWGPKPYVDRIEYHMIRSAEARLIALEKGEIHIAQYMDAEHFPILDKDANLTRVEALGPFVMQKYYFNFRHWPANDLRFRRAVWMGADWKNIAINARAFKSGLYASTLLYGSDFYNPEAEKLVPGYNPEEAKKLIEAVEKDAGKKIPPIYWLSSNSSEGKAVAEVAKIQLAQIGVNLDLHLLSRAIWYEKGYKDPKAEWDLFGYGLGFGLDPNLGFMTFATDSGTHIDGKSIGGYSNPEFDNWLLKAETAVNDKARVKAYQEAELVLLKDVASIPLENFNQVHGVNKKVKNYTLTNTTNIYVTTTWNNVWLDE